MAGQTSVKVTEHYSNPFLRFVSGLSTLAGWCSAFMIVCAVGITCQMIFVRKILNHSTVWQTEVVIYLAIGATLIGLPYVQRLRGHVNVDLFPLMLGNRLRYYLAILTYSMSIIVMAIVLWHGYELWHTALTRGWRSDSVLGVPLWIPYLSMVIGFGLFVLQLIADLFAVILKVDKPFGLEEK